MSPYIVKEAERYDDKKATLHLFVQHEFYRICDKNKKLQP